MINRESQRLSLNYSAKNGSVQIDPENCRFTTSLRGPLGPWQSPVPCDAEIHPMNIVHFDFSMLSETEDHMPISVEIATSG